MTLTPIEQAMMWERMSGERLSDAERQRILDGGEFQPPNDDLDKTIGETITSRTLLSGSPMR